MWKRLFLTSALVVVAQFLCLALSYALPNAPIREKISEAAKVLETEGQYPKTFLYDRSVALDNFTDAIILNVAYDGKGNSLVQKTVENAYFQEGDEAVGGLVATTNGAEPNSSYARYWFGTSALVRILMLVFSYTDIRAILAVAILGLAILVIVEMTKKLGGKYAVAFGVTLIYLRFFMLGYSLQFAPVTIITLAMALAILKLAGRKDFKEKLKMLFLLDGALVAFFDLLTFPLISFGIPATVALLFMLKDKKANEKKIAKTLIVYALLWGGAYAVNMLLKWAASGLILGGEAFSAILASLGNRFELENVSTLGALARNGGTMFGIITAIIPAAYFGGWMAYALRTKSLQKNWKKFLLFLAIALLPYLWYAVFTNHSYVHFWFTYRAQAVFIFAALCGSIFLTRRNVIE